MKCFAQAILLLGLGAGNLWGQTYGVPATGQTSIYHASAPNDPGDDGVIRAGYPLTGIRFSAEAQTVTDAGTGLMWQKSDSSDQTIGSLGGKLTWDQAFQYVSAMNVQKLGGYSDWRVPNAKELLSIANLGTFFPATYTIFPNHKSDYYWTGSSWPPGELTLAAVMHFTDGIVNWNASSSDLCYVKATRSAHATPGVRGFPKTGQEQSRRTGDDGDLQAGYPTTGENFADNGDGTVTQKATDLVWQKSDSGFQALGSHSGALSWEDAFAYVAEMNQAGFAGHSDWRLPNYFELYGMIDLGEKFPVFDPIFKSSSHTGRYWASSTSFNGHQGWTVEGNAGIGSFQPKEDLYYVRAVRGGGCAPAPTPPLYPTPTPDPATLRGLPKSGQTASYHAGGGLDRGDDGAVQAGYPMNGNRFQSNSNGTVTDYATGLMWADASSGLLSWEQGFAYIANLNNSGYAGYGDWRMPNFKEIYSIVNHGAAQPSAYPGFNGTNWTQTNIGYWGSTSYADMPNGWKIFQVDFREGYMIEAFMPDSPSGFVRAVRSLAPPCGQFGFPKSGQTVVHHWPNLPNDRGDDGAVQSGYPVGGQRFVDLGDDTIRDNATGLVWQKTDSVLHQVGTYKNTMKWEDAFAYVRGLNQENYAGHSEWRLPNIVELLTLADYSQFSPALDPLFINFTRTSWYWTSTTRQAASTDAWVVHMGNCFNTFRPKCDFYYVRAVRGGPGTLVAPTPVSPSPTPNGYHSPSPTPALGATPTPPPHAPTPPSHPYYGLPKTGQTDKYHWWGNFDMGDDGCVQAGYPVDHERFTVTGWGTVIDWAAGLMWQQNDSYHQSFGGLSGPVTWDDAFAYVKAMNLSRFAGYSDWRLPNCLELLATRDLGKIFGVQDVFQETTTEDEDFWTSSCAPNGGEDANIFYLGYKFGHLLTKNIGQSPSPRCLVRAVRSFYAGSGPEGFPRTGQTAIVHPAGSGDLGDDGAARAGYPRSEPRFTDNGNGTASDRATGLTWQLGCSPAAVTWENAFAYVKGTLNERFFADRTDWRVPNDMELFSLVDYGRSGPAIDPLFANTPAMYFWSGSSCAMYTTNAWAVSFNDGQGDQLPKINCYYVRAVCGEPRGGLRPTPTPLSVPQPILESGDYDGDGATEIGIYRPASGLWSLRRLTQFYLGAAGDRPASGDFNGDGVGDAALFRSATGLWVVRGLTKFYFGSSSDVSVPADYTGEGKSAAGVFRPTRGFWAIRDITRAFFGQDGDGALPADYDGDGTAEIAVFRPGPGIWAVRDLTRVFFGGAFDVPLSADFNGDGTADIGIFRGASSLWAVRGVTSCYFGAAGDWAVPADYGLSRKAAIAIFRSAKGLWALRGMTCLYFGANGDIPIAR